MRPSHVKESCIQRGAINVFCKRPLGPDKDAAHGFVGVERGHSRPIHGQLRHIGAGHRTAAMGRAGLEIRDDDLVRAHAQAVDLA